jgi:hypothetical protein
MICKICLEPPKAPHVTPCGHVFCHEHIKQWFRQESSCPVCRRQVNRNKELIAIFADDDEDEGVGLVVPASERDQGKEGEGGGGGGGGTAVDVERVGVLGCLTRMQNQWEANMLERSRLRDAVRELSKENKSLSRHVTSLKQDLEIARRGGDGGSGGDNRGGASPTSRGSRGSPAGGDVRHAGSPTSMYGSPGGAASREGKTGGGAGRSGDGVGGGRAGGATTSDGEHEFCPADVERSVLGSWRLDATMCTSAKRGDRVRREMH